MKRLVLFQAVALASLRVWLRVRLRVGARMPIKFRETEVLALAALLGMTQV